MKKLWTLFILVFIVLCQKTNSGTICLSCNNLAEGELCAGNEVCKNDEVCFIQKYTKNGNENRYDVGCAYPELCQKDLAVHVFGRRSDHSHVLCHKCCNNTDVCNAHLSCNDKISVPMQKCLSCSEIEDPKMCKNVTTCAKDEICYLHKYTTHSNQQLIDVGCKHSALCTQGFSNILGRRSSVGVHQECESCCSGAAFCNHDLQCNHVPEKTINKTCSTTNECIGNLVCLSGTCKCQSDQYYWDVNTCYKRQNANGRCISDHQCQQSLSCVQHTCKCVGKQYWNGSLCESKKTIHLTCSSSDECLDTLYCNHGHCKCDATIDYWNGSSCLTGKLYNELCGNSLTCQGSFRCINKKCSCLSSEYFDGYQCLTRKILNESCVNTQECQATSRCTNYICTCLPMYYSDGAQCLTRKTNNEACRNGQECRAVFSCINKTCRCILSEFWNGSQCRIRKTYNEPCDNSNECQAAFQCINKACKCISSEYWDTLQCLQKRLECEDIPEDRDGVYTIYPGGGDMTVPVYCIMRETKKWTVSFKLYSSDGKRNKYVVIQTRVNGSVDFDRTWMEYKKGFGSPFGEYWLGNDNIHLIAAKGHHELGIYMEKASGNHGWGNYSTFSIADERNQYVLKVAGYTGDFDGNGLDYQGTRFKANGYPFTTKDRDNDSFRGNCAANAKCGWWYNACYNTNLNLPYYENKGTMKWYSSLSISKTIMMIRKT